MRAFWVKFHLCISAFFLPMLLLMGISGGLYLLGFKGSVEKTVVEVAQVQPIDAESGTLKQDIDGLLQANGIVHVFEYVKISGPTLTTRPTSRDWYEIQAGDTPTITFVEPDLVKRLVELHKGHGPGLYKNLQKVMALGLMIMLFSGLWLGLSSPTLVKLTLGVVSAGTVVLFVTAFLL